MGIHWLFVTTAVVVFVQSYLYKKRGLKHIHYTRFFSEQAVFEGGCIDMVEVISNRKLLPVPWLRLESRINANLQFGSQANLTIVDDQFHRSLFSLMSFQKITRRHKVYCAKRGHYYMKTVSFTNGDLLGIDHSSKTHEVFASVIVYPKLIPTSDIPYPSTSWQGDVAVRRWIVDDPFVFAGVRDYAAGDSMRSINWKATARTGELMISKKDYTADPKLMIYLNFDETEDIWLPIKNEALIEKGISLAASMAQQAISQGIPTGFGCNSYIVEPFEKQLPIKSSVRIDPGSGKNQLQYILETLAKVKIDRSMNFNQFLSEDLEEKTTGKDIVIITALVSDKMNERCRVLTANGNSVSFVPLEMTGAEQEGGEDDRKYEKSHC
ncbi:Uncharacterized conserved protein, DUF58 family, contains vWF domain [Evansella caseinilytica]|uniref:Uncharacterized conserved protein, DUF58 family, contains vWF domain n=1 Tax=Evansella caseinilytica TaxID=1503961 RepID=A0A1H3NW67_9BACI|nr:DUF58 domain-containing protein [Evansella caseinilytica]SDY93132.1 Uncharacterized conserved protein, DUF58 family, contains vWF domain [Evansella caseinilytica]